MLKDIVIKLQNAFLFYIIITLYFC